LLSLNLITEDNMVRRLNQVVAIEKPLKQTIEKKLAELYKALQKSELFEGHDKIYHPKDVDGDTLPSDIRMVQQRVGDILEETSQLLTELFDVSATRDLANCSAKADVVLDGVKVLEGVPATTLMFLEKQLTEFRIMVAAAPELDPAESWESDENSGLERTIPRNTIRTARVNKPIVLYPATEKHPAQTQLVTEDRTVGTWEAIRLSGAVSATAKKALLARVEAFITAVKLAREEANCLSAQDVSIGKKVFGWINND
jgi:hypothetical protein